MSNRGGNFCIRFCVPWSGKLKLDTEGVIFGQKVYNSETAGTTPLSGDINAVYKEVCHEVHKRRTVGNRAANIRR